MALSIELTPEVMSIGGLLIGGIGWVATYLLSSKDKQIAKLEEENAAYRLRINTLQDRALETLQRQIEDEREQAKLMTYFARSLEGQTEAIKSVVRKP